MSKETDKKLVLIFVNGQDHPGVTAGLMKCISRAMHKINNIFDMEYPFLVNI